MIARRDDTRYAVRLSVARRGSRRMWGAASGAFERNLAAQESRAVTAPHIESESRRGPDYVRVTLALTVAAPDVAQALTTAWWVFRKAADGDSEGWDMSSATAEVRPEEALAGAACGVNPGRYGPAWIGLADAVADGPSVAPGRFGCRQGGSDI
jgi:hypothetical protein